MSWMDDTFEVTFVGEDLRSGDWPMYWARKPTTEIYELYCGPVPVGYVTGTALRHYEGPKPIPVTFDWHEWWRSDGPIDLLPYVKDEDLRSKRDG